MGIVELYLGQARAVAHGQDEWHPQALRGYWLDHILSGAFLLSGSEDKFTSETYQAFFRTVLRKTRGPQFLIHDGAKYHTGKATRAFLTAHQARLTVYQLPSYSPDYNPIECLWRKIKREVTHGKYFAAFEHVVHSVDQTLAAFTRRAAAVLNLFGQYFAEIGLDQSAPAKSKALA